VFEGAHLHRRFERDFDHAAARQGATDPLAASAGLRDGRVSAIAEPDRPACTARAAGGGGVAWIEGTCEGTRRAGACIIPAQPVVRKGQPYAQTLRFA